MQLCSAHGYDGPNPQRSGRAPPQAQGQSCARRDVDLGVPPAGDREIARAAHARGASRTAPKPRARRAQGADRDRGLGGARGPLIVLDASAAVEVLLQTAAGAPITERLLDPAESLHAPHLLDVEVAQILRRFVRRGELMSDRARQALDDLASLPLERYSHER